MCVSLRVNVSKASTEKSLRNRKYLIWCRVESITENLLQKIEDHIQLLLENGGLWMLVLECWMSCNRKEGYHDKFNSYCYCDKLTATWWFKTENKLLSSRSESQKCKIRLTGLKSVSAGLLSFWILQGRNGYFFCLKGPPPFFGQWLPPLTSKISV